jgi:hypothetical protein
MNAVRDEIKCRPALHLDGITLVMRQDECRHMIRRLFTPPTFPIFIRPSSADRPKHVSPEYPRAFAAHALYGEIIVDTRLAAFESMLITECFSFKERRHEICPIHTKRIVYVLIETGGISVDRNCDVLYYDF